MGSVWLTLRAGLRPQWRALFALALMLGLIGGVVLAAAAGARRTETAYPRLLRWAHASQVRLISGGSGRFYQGLRRLPQVASISEAGYYNTLLPARNGAPLTQIAAYASQDGSFGLSADRVKVLSGRIFGESDPRAAMIDPQLAAMEHLRPGSTLRLLVVPSNSNGIQEPGRAIPMAFRVTAIVLFDTQVVPATQANAEPTALLSPPFTRTRIAASASFGSQIAVRLRPGASTAGFVHAATALAGTIPALRKPGALDVVDLADQVTATQRAVGAQALALAAFAALAGLIALAVTGQLLSRQLALDSADFPILRALGMTRGGLATLSLIRIAAVTAAGGALATAIAVAASPLMPIGPARAAEPGPGIDVNLAILGAGFGAIAVLPVLLVAPAAWLAAGRPRGRLGVAAPAGPARGSRIGRVMDVAGSVTGGVGVRMAFESGRGRTAVPVRSALLGTAVAIAAMVAALVFGTSLLHLIGTPRLYGQGWQQKLDLNFGAVPATVGARLMSSQPGLAGYAAGNYGRLNVNGVVVPAIGIDQVRGGDFLTLLSGRPPLRPGEIAVGAQTLSDIRGRLGERLPVLVNGKRLAMRIVGVVVLPAFGQGTIVSTNLGSGVVVPASVLSVPDLQTHCSGQRTCYNFFLARYLPGTSMQAAARGLNDAADDLGCPPQACTVTSDQRPADIRDYGSVRGTPLVLGIVLALLAAGTLAHVLLTGLRRRRRDLAVLKIIGLRRRQVLWVVSWQATALAAAALLAGLPLGVLAGRWAWDLFAGSASVAPVAEVPLPLVLLVIPVTLLLANMLAAGPGWAAARIRPAPILRSE